MASRLLQLDDVRQIETPDKIAYLFKKLGYNASAQQLDKDDLELPSRSAEAIWNAYLIADQGKGALQVLLFQLQAEEFSSPSIASSRMRAIAQSLCKRPSNFLLLGTKDYNQLMLVNPRKSFDAQMNLRTSIRKLLIDRTNPTNYDRDRLEAIAARNLDPQELYKVQCEAFDVEKLTKQFYIGYEKLFDSVQKVIKQHNPHPYFDDPSRLHQFAQRLLGRIMFLYFLQKKGFLASDRNFLTTQYRKLQRTTEPEGTEFYSQVLEPLFFETLNKQRPNFESRWGQIPYLNGGLFDWDYGPGVRDAAGRQTPDHIQLPNSLFDSGSTGSILGFFNSYNFTVAENVQGDEDVAVDPEMLGKVFENLLAKEERGQSGTFYTPRGIVHFMCVEVLSRYLADKSGMSPDAIRQLMELDPDITDANLKQLLSREQARKLKQALEEVKCLDPAVGSAAFPLGMMQVILSVRQAIARREGMTIERGSLTISHWKRDIIANNLYGVDIKPEAIEIAKLRMWLSLVVDVPSIEDLDPLPNLDYKLMCGDSLISTINGEQLIPDPTKTQQTMLAVTPIQQAIQPLLELQQQYYSAQSEERKAMREQIIEAEANVFRVAIADRHQYWEGEQRKLEQDIRHMRGRASHTQTQKQQMIAKKLAELGKFAAEVESGERSLAFFQYHLHFNDVFQEKGGFDIVIGNPPYLGQKGNKETFEEVKKGVFYRFYKRNMDYFYFFFHLALDMCKTAGYTAFITTNYYLTADGAVLLREDLKNRAVILKLINFNELSIFQSARGQHNIISILEKFNNNDIKAEFCLTKRHGNMTDDILQQIISWKDEETSYFSKRQEELYEGTQSYIRLTEEMRAENYVIKNIPSSTILEKILKSGSLLGDICKVNQGILSGADKVTEKHISKRLVNSALKNHGVYVLPESELLALNLYDHEKNIIKPFFKNSDIKNYFCSLNTRKFLIYATRDLEISNYPNIYTHFLKFEEVIKARSQDRGEIQAALKLGKWWVIFAARDESIFSGKKIICPQRSTRNSFAYNETEWYTSADVYFITEKDKNISLKYVLALLNSSLYYFWLYFKGKRKGESLELYYTPLTEIPIKRISPSEQRLFIDIVDQILSFTRDESYLTNSLKQSMVKKYEHQINRMVFELYGLTQEEIAVVEGVNNPK